MKQKIMFFLCNEKGLTTVEYAVAGALVAAAVVAAFTLLGGQVGDVSASNHQNRQRSGDGGNRTHLHIDAAGGDDQSHAQGHNKPWRRLFQQVHQTPHETTVLDGNLEETLGENQVEQEDHPEGDQGPLNRFDSCSQARGEISSLP